jgi:hypothetical protein
MNRQAKHIRALAMYLALGCALQLPASAGRELAQGESAADIQPINAVEPLIVPPAPPKKWDLAGSVTVSAVYNDNIFLGSSAKVGDFLFTIAPSVSLTLGSPDGTDAGYLTLNYAPGFVHYAEHSAQDSVNQSAQVSTGYRFSRLAVGLSLSYNKAKEANAEVGGLVNEQNYSAALTSKYDLTDISSVELNLSRTFNGFQGFLNVSDMTVQGYYNSRITEAITLSLGAAYGSAQAQGSAAQAYEQVTVRATYKTTEQLSFNANVGGDFRDGGDGTRFSPIFGLAANYTPFDSTNISLSGSRTVEPSAVLVQEDKQLTSIYLAVRQRFLQRYFLTPSIGYDHSDYSASTQGVSTIRTDNSIAFGLSAATNLTDRWSLQIFYQYRRNASTAESFSFTDQQIGLSSSVKF